MNSHVMLNSQSSEWWQQEVERFVVKIGKKLCDLDPIPASIFKECKSTLLPILTNMVNMSLQSAFFPATLKEAMIKTEAEEGQPRFWGLSKFQTHLKSEGFIKNNRKGSILSIWVITYVIMI